MYDAYERCLSSVPVDRNDVLDVAII
jgi:hypothetical protein